MPAEPIRRRATRTIAWHRNLATPGLRGKPSLRRKRPPRRRWRRVSSPSAVSAGERATWPAGPCVDRRGASDVTAAFASLLIGLFVVAALHSVSFRHRVEDTL